MPDDTLKQVAPASVIKAISPHPAAVNERRRHRERQDGRQEERKKRKKGHRKAEDRVTITGRDHLADTGPNLRPISPEMGTYHDPFKKGKGGRAFPPDTSRKHGGRGDGKGHPSKGAEAPGPSESGTEKDSMTSRIDIRI